MKKEGNGVEEGFLNFIGYNIYWKSFGEPLKGNILCLHGGPGATHDYMLPIAWLAERGYRVVFYDQLGCGRSELPKNKALFVPETYVEEVETVRKKLKLGRPILIGSSWGGMLAIAYCLKYQRNLRAVITVGGLHNVPMTFREMEKMKKKLPPEVLKKIEKYESEGDYENKEYQEAVMVFYKRHLCRLESWPEELKYSLEKISKPVYYTMNGPNEFSIIGNIRYWDVSDKLQKINVPFLILTGKYDEVSPKVARDMHKLIKNSKIHIFKNSSHLPFWEEKENFKAVVERFLYSIT